MRFREFSSTARQIDAPKTRVKISALSGDHQVPIVIEPASDGLDLADWAQSAKSLIDQHLYKAGAVLFRKFQITNVADFERVVRAISTTGELMNYVENTSPRTTIRGNVKTSTDHPADQEIVPHNEHSFSNVFPSKLFLCCRTTPLSGGETPLSDCRRITERLPQEIRQRFRSKGGYLYVRNFGNGFGPDWPTVFQTRDRTLLERYLRANDIGFEWRPGDRLRIWYRRPTEVIHPVTRETVWFNHLLFWHISSLETSVREVLLRSFSEWDLPNQSFYGDGSSIEPEMIELLRQIYQKETRQTPWHINDVLVVDNVLLAHGRRAYTGKRLVLFAMADPWTREQVNSN